MSDLVLSILMIIGFICFLIITGKKRCPYCKSIVDVELDYDWAFCPKCHNSIKIKRHKIFMLEDKPPLAPYGTAVLLFIMEYTNLNFPINNKNRNDIYNFIIKNFKLSMKQQMGLKRICEATLVHGNWGPLSCCSIKYGLFPLCDLIQTACDSIQKDTSKIYNSSIIDSIFKLFNKKENKFDDGLKFKYDYRHIIDACYELIKQGLSNDVPKYAMNPAYIPKNGINSAYNNININKLKNDLLKDILRIIGWNSGKISDVQSYMVKSYIEKFDILLEDFINLTENKQKYQDNNYRNEDITLEDSYKLLNVNKNSSKEEIINSYNHLMKVYDVSTIDLPDELKKDFYAKRKKIQQAYELIMKVCR